MEKSRIIEDFQFEFDYLYCGNKGLSIEFVLRSLFTNLEEIDVAKSVIDLEKKRNRRRKFLSNVLGKHAEKFGYLDPWYYDMDDGYLERKEELLGMYREQLNAFYGAIDDYNCSEVYNLMNFARYKNRFYRREVEQERENLKGTAKGAEVCFEKPGSNAEYFSEWFGEAIEKVCGTKAVEKVKK